MGAAGRTIPALRVIGIDQTRTDSDSERELQPAALGKEFPQRVE
jgi:hypothetical protein